QNPIRARPASEPGEKSQPRAGDGGRKRKSGYHSGGSGVSGGVAMLRRALLLAAVEGRDAHLGGRSGLSPGRAAPLETVPGAARYRGFAGRRSRAGHGVLGRRTRLPVLGGP